jgi:hypothetical protein
VGPGHRSGHGRLSVSACVGPDGRGKLGLNWHGVIKQTVCKSEERRVWDQFKLGFTGWKRLERAGRKFGEIVRID